MRTGVGTYILIILVRTYTWGGGRNQKKKDGEITVQQTETSSKKVVSNEVGDYVEYEDIREETSESRRE